MAGRGCGTASRRLTQGLRDLWAAGGALKVCWISGWCQCALVLRCDLTPASLACSGLFQRAGPQRFSARERRLLRPCKYSTMPRYRYRSKLRFDDSGVGALPRAVASCVAGGDRQRCLVAIAAKRGAPRRRGCQSQRQPAIGGLFPDPSFGL